VGVLRRWLMLLVVVALGAAVLPGCLVIPGDTSQIALVSSSTVDGWQFDYYRNSAYPCAAGGFQTFVVGTRVGTSAATPAPLWVSMHGDGVGWFDSAGNPQPDANQMSEESASSLQATLTNAGLVDRIRNSPAGFRLLAVSYCDQDRYGGTGQSDVNNPTLNGDGSQHLTNGLQATKAAIQFVRAQYVTSKFYLGGVGAGSAGAFYAGYALQQSGMPPAGVVGDSGVVNAAQGLAAYQQGVCSSPEYAQGAFNTVAQRVDPAIADSNNEIDKLIARGDFKVPVLHVWNRGDTDTCGNTPMQCPLPNNTVITLGATDCNHRPLADAIAAAQGPSSRSMNLPVCVDDDPIPDCSLHVVTTTAGLTNTEPATQSDYLAAIVNWVESRVGSLYAWGDDLYGQVGDGAPPNQIVPTRIGNDTSWTSIDAGVAHTLAIKTDGTLWAWGKNASHQLGDGTMMPRSSPVQIGTDTHWASVSAGYDHSVALKTDGTLWAWGTVVPEVGGLQYTNYSTPHQIGAATNWASASAGSFYTMARRTDGTLWAWGYNNFGQFGNGTTTGQNNPTQIGSATDWAFVVAAGIHTVAVKTDGTLWAWGYNFSGEVGDGTTIHRHSPVQIGTDTNWVSANGVDYTAALKTDGTLWAWGANQSGQLGDGTTTGHKSPAQVGTGTDWTAVAAGGHFPMATKADGTLWAWGDNSAGQLGDGTTTNRTSPAQVGTDTDWSTVGAGDFHTVAIKADGTLWTWGRNDVGQLGNGTPFDHTKPLNIGTDTNWRTIATGYVHTVAIKADGTLWAWGTADLGNGTNQSASPIQIGTDANWSTVTAGTYFTAAIKTDGTLWAWGYNGFGQIGDGTTTNRLSPVQVGTGTNWRMVAAGQYHTTMAIKTDGTLWGWGENSYGQIGDGTKTNRLSPVQVGTGTNWRTVSAGFVTTAAIKTDNTLWRWGWLYPGPDDFGTFDGVTTPQPAGVGASWSSVSAGRWYTMAIRTDGTLWGIGANDVSQIGCNCDTVLPQFTQVGTAASWVSVDAGVVHTVAIRADGSMWATGGNFFGQLGIGTNDPFPNWEPMQIGIGTKWAVASAGDRHTAAIAAG
jgi:alpha-tubulin suppressor-like RCC1 family protein